MNVNEVEVSAMERDWEAFLAPYEQTIRQNRQKGVDQMTQMLEIEYKSMLTKQEYEIFIAHYQLTDKDFRVQTNIYFDTLLIDSER